MKTRFTYGDFGVLSWRAAFVLQKEGIKEGDKVFALLPNSIEFAAFFFGCLFIKAIFCPINMSLHSEEVKFILNHCDGKIILTTPDTSTLLSKSQTSQKIPEIVLGLNNLNFFEERIIQKNICLHQMSAQPNWSNLQKINDLTTSIILFTSGSTGTPKGVIHRTKTLFTNAQSLLQMTNLGPEAVFFNVWPMAYASGLLNNLICAFSSGGQIVMGKVFSATIALNFWKLIIEYNVNVLWLSPSMITTLTQIDRDPLGVQYLKNASVTIISATAPLPEKEQIAFESKYGVTLYKSYGLTELLFVTIHTPSMTCKKKSVGKFLPGIIYYIKRDGEANNQSSMGAGEIVIESPWLAEGYLNTDTHQSDPMEAFPLFFTGDIGYVDDEGYLFVTDRKKDIIIRGGYNISPRLIEEILIRHPIIQNVVIVGLPHNLFGEEIVAAVVLKPGYHLCENEVELKKYCQQNLNKISLPNKFIQLESIPTGSTGKISRLAIKDLILNKYTKEDDDSWH